MKVQRRSFIGARKIYFFKKKEQHKLPLNFILFNGIFTNETLNCRGA